MMMKLKEAIKLLTIDRHDDDYDPCDCPDDYNTLNDAFNLILSASKRWKKMIDIFPELDEVEMVDALCWWDENMDNYAVYSKKPIEDYYVYEIIQEFRKVKEKEDE